MYSNPPSNGAWVAAKMLSIEEHKVTWKKDLREIRERFSKIRRGFYDLIKEAIPERNWEYIKEQTSPFFYLELTGH